MFAVCSKTTPVLSFQVQTQIFNQSQTFLHLFCQCTQPCRSCITVLPWQLFSRLPTSCRHATISKFFGDKCPNCAGACDYCCNPKVVRAQLERAATLSTKTEAQSKAPKGPFGFQADLYEGGKKGYGFERQDNFSDAIWNVWFVPLGRMKLTPHLAGMMNRKLAVVKMMAQREKTCFLSSSRSRWTCGRWITITKAHKLFLEKFIFLYN